MTVSIPAWPATTAAARGLSPVIMATASPMALKAATAPGADGFKVSAMARIPAREPPLATRTSVLPSPCRRSMAGLAAAGPTMPRRAKKGALPTVISSPASAAFSPSPSRVSNPWTAGTARPPGGGGPDDGLAQGVQRVAFQRRGGAQHVVLAFPPGRRHR